MSRENANQSPARPTTSTTTPGDDSNPEDPGYLQDVWCVYFHDPENQDWNLNSYKRICNVSTIHDFWAMQAGIAPYLVDGMFFIMREHVYPCWDDPANLRGGCLSLKFARDKLHKSWELMLQRMLGETIVKSTDTTTTNHSAHSMWDAVNGMSISPKRYFSIVKLWLREGAPTQPSAYHLPPWYASEVLYRSNEDSIKERNDRCSSGGERTTT